MKELKVAVIGAGFIGGIHLETVKECEGLTAVGVADALPEASRKLAEQFGIEASTDHIELIEKTRPDYAVICTPHKSHAELAVAAMNRGVHVLVEKPITVYASKAGEIVETAKKTGMKLEVNFARRFKPTIAKLKELIVAGFPGNITRASIVLTEWFRSMFYYRSGTWRGTWDGEGGGVIVNQAPHDLDLIVWALGLPSEVCAEINTSGHDIEVEDDLCAMLKWPNGALGTLQVNTNEAPGRTCFEITGTKGTLLLDGTSLKATRMTHDVREFSETTTQKMEGPPTADTITYELPDTANRYALMHQNFADAIRNNAPLICSGEDALAEVELANALLVSGIKRTWVSTPVDPAEFDRIMAQLVESRNIDKAREALGVG